MSSRSAGYRTMAMNECLGVGVKSIKEEMFALQLGSVELIVSTNKETEMNGRLRLQRCGALKSPYKGIVCPENGDGVIYLLRRDLCIDGTGHCPLR
jgi:hypothetical protein